MTIGEVSAPRLVVVKPTRPALIVTGPENGFDAFRFNTPAPDFVRPLLPVIEPDTSSEPPVTKKFASALPKAKPLKIDSALVELPARKMAPLVMARIPLPDKLPLPE